MFRYAYSEELCLLVVIADGSPNSDRDLQSLVDALERIDRDGETRGRTTASIIVAEGLTQPPSAVWRARIADLRKNVRAPLACVSFVTDSAVLRGVGTAIAWLIPPPANLHSEQHASIEEAAAWVEREHGAPASFTMQLHEQARRRSPSLAP